MSNLARLDMLDNLNMPFDITEVNSREYKVGWKKKRLIEIAWLFIYAGKSLLDLPEDRLTFRGGTKTAGSRER